MLKGTKLKTKKGRVNLLRFKMCTQKFHLQKLQVLSYESFKFTTKAS